MYYFSIMFCLVSYCVSDLKHYIKISNLPFGCLGFWRWLELPVISSNPKSKEKIIGLIPEKMYTSFAFAATQVLLIYKITHLINNKHSSTWALSHSGFFLSTLLAFFIIISISVLGYLVAALATTLWYFDLHILHSVHAQLVNLASNRKMSTHNTRILALLYM